MAIRVVASNHKPRAPALVVLPGGGERPRYTDEEIVRAVVSGDTRVSRELYVRLVDSIDITLFRIFGRREADHEDLVQRAFEQIVITLMRRSFAGACSLKTWASAVAARVAFNALRARKRERAFVDFSGEFEVEKRTGGDAEAQTLARDELVRLRSALVGLKPERASAVFLHDVLGHELAEIALLEGITVAAAQSRLVRGRKDLYERLGVSDSNRRRRG